MTVLCFLVLIPRNGEKLGMRHVLGGQVPNLLLLELKPVLTLLRALHLCLLAGIISGIISKPIYKRPDGFTSPNLSSLRGWEVFVC